MDNEIVISGYEVSDNFIKKYETYMEMIKDFEYGSLYKVKVTLNNEGIKSGVMERIELNRGESQKLGFYKSSESEVMFIKRISHEDEGVHEVEIYLDHILKGDKYGTFIWECVRT